MISILPVKRIQPRRYQPGGVGNWSGHLPFIHDLVEATRPSVFVELGTHYGESYFGVCQAVDENKVPCKCFAVDTWLGDEQAGFYDASVFQEVTEYNESNYSGFSSLLRTTFDEAQSRFPDGGIDLLHIDGLHTYDTVKHDFENWLPKVRAGGIVLLHDTEARHADFGVWKLWEELALSFPHFSFAHSWGLGLIRKPGREEEDSIFVKQLFLSPPQDTDFIRHYYTLEGDVLNIPSCGMREEGARLKAELTEARAELQKLRLEETGFQSKLQQSEEQRKKAADDLENLQQQFRLEREKQVQLEREFSGYASEVNRLNEALRSERTQRTALLNSYSWKISWPFRRVIDIVRSFQS